jgi:hypothetical protein
MDFGSAMKRKWPQKSQIVPYWLLAEVTNDQIVIHLATKLVYWRKFELAWKDSSPKKFKYICFLDQGLDGGYAFVVQAKTTQTRFHEIITSCTSGSYGTA